MKKSFILFASLLMFFININYANGEDFKQAINTFAKNVSDSALKSINLEYIEQRIQTTERSYNIEFTVDKNGNFSNFKVITSTGNKEVDEYIINTIKKQAHKYPLPSQMANIQQHVKLNLSGKFGQQENAYWQEYTNKITNEVYKNADTIDSWIKEAPNGLKNAAYTIYIDKEGIFYNIKVTKSTGDANFDSKMVNLIKSKSGTIPLPENCKTNVKSYTITFEFD